MKNKLNLIYLLFFFSGFTALIYELIWIRKLTITFGATGQAIVAVLSIFFIGLSLGSLIFSRLKNINSLKIYALIEIAIGIFALFTPLVALISQTILMGGTFPLVSDFVKRNWGSESKIAVLYFINTLGGVLGVILTTFVLISLFGVNGSLIFASIINFSIGFLAYWLSRSFKESEVVYKETVREKSVNPRADVIFVFAFFLTGLAGISLEIYWTRVLAMVFGGSVYAFSVVLASYLLGIAIGAILIYWIIDLLRNRLIFLVILNLLLGLVVLSLSPLLPLLPLRFVKMFASWGESFSGISFTYFFISVFAMLLPTILMGMVFPLGIITFKGGFDFKRKVGSLYAVNTLGSVAGAVLSTLIILPGLGVQIGIWIAVFIYLLVGLLLLFLLENKKNAAILILLSIFIAVGIGYFTQSWDKSLLSYGIYSNPDDFINKDDNLIKKIVANSKILFYKDGVNSTVSITKDLYEGTLSLRIDGKADASTGADMENQVLLGHLPMFFHKDPKDVLVIGLGSGVTLGSVEQYPVEKIDAIEIEPAVVKGAEFFKDFNNDALNDKRLNLVIADGRNFLSKTNKKYDIITSEPSNLWLTGVANLFTDEFYSFVKSRLKDDGVVVQWLHIYAMSEDDLKMAVNTFYKAFPNAVAFNVFTSDDLLLIGGKNEIKLTSKTLEEKLALDKVKKDLERVGIEDPSDILSYFTLDSSAIKSFVGSAKTHGDNWPVLEFSAPKSLYKPTQAENLRRIMSLWVNLEGFYKDDFSSSDLKIAQDMREKFAKMMLNFTEYNIAEGITLGEEVLSIKPRRIGVKEYLSRLYFDKAFDLMNRGENEGSKKALRRSLEINPVSQTRMVLGSIYLEEGNLDLARQEFEKALVRSPEVAEIHFNLGNVLLLLGKTKEARAEFEETLKIDPTFLEAKEALAKVRVRE